MKYLKFTQTGYEAFTGQIGRYDFVDGLSVEPMHRSDRDRLATSFQFDEIDEDGNRQEAGAAARLVNERSTRAVMPESLAVQTQAEKDAEIAALAATVKKDVKGIAIFTYQDLEKIVEKGGINGLRKIAEPWGVRSRSIPDLMKLIMDAQSTYVEGRERVLESAPETKVKVTPEKAPEVNPEAASVVVPDVAPDVSTEIEQAAATGDLSAALDAAE